MKLHQLGIIYYSRDVFCLNSSPNHISYIRHRNHHPCPPPLGCCSIEMLYLDSPQHLEKHGNTFLLAHCPVWCNKAKNKCLEKGRVGENWKCSVCKTWSAFVMKYLFQCEGRGLCSSPHRMVKLEAGSPVVKW